MLIEKFIFKIFINKLRQNKYTHKTQKRIWSFIVGIGESQKEVYSRLHSLNIKDYS